MLSGNKDTQSHTYKPKEVEYFSRLINIEIFALNHLDIYELAYLATNI